MASDTNLIAARYVDALFALAAEQKQQDAVKKDMEALLAVFDQSEQARKFIVNPVMNREQSAQAMDAMLEALKASALSRKFFSLLAKERRLAISPVAAKLYLQLLAKSRNELQVEVTAASALSDAQLASIADALSKSTGKKVNLKASTNPALIGGLQVRVGSKMLDSSLAGKLDRLRQALTKVA